MKSFIFMALISLLATGVEAQKIAVKSGKIDFLKNEKSIAVSFTYEDLKVGKDSEAAYIAKKKKEADEKNPGSGDSWHQAWVNDRSARYEPKFIELFNEQMSAKNGITIGKEAGGKYLMKINTFFTEPGFNIGISRKPAIVSVLVTFTDETGATVATISVDNSSAASFGGFDFDAAYRIQESYAKAGRELAKFLIKNLKL